MDNNGVVLSDAERNKELFEYEMTEVLAQFRDEFSGLSKSKLDLDDAQFEAPKINIEIKDTEIKTTPVDLDMPGSISAEACYIRMQPVTVDKPDIKIVRPSVPNEKIDIPGVVLEKKSVDCPAVPDIRISQIKLFDITALKPDCPTVDTRMSADMGNVDIRPVPADIEIKREKVNMAVKFPEPDIRPADIDVPRIPEINFCKLREVSVDSKASVSVKIPDIGRIAADIPVIRPEKPDLDIERFDADKFSVPGTEMPDIKLEKQNIDCERPVIGTFSSPEVRIQAIMSEEPVKCPDFTEDIRSIIESVI